MLFDKIVEKGRLNGCRKYVANARITSINNNSLKK